MKLFIGLLMAVLPIITVAQHGTIKVIDEKSGQGLPYVHISLRLPENGKELFLVANSNGVVDNPYQDTCLISISYMGYKTLQDTLFPQASSTFYLEPDIFDLDQVVVTATRTNKALKDAPVITQVINSRAIKNSGTTRVDELLTQEVPGLEMQRGGFGSDIKLQGLDAKNILILVDGERLAGETGNNIDYSRLNTANVERIEVVKGAASALYGSQAMGGVINIITKKSRKPLEISAGVRWTQPNERNYPDLDEKDDKYLSKKNLDLVNLNLNLSAGYKLKHFSGRTDFMSKSFDGYLLYDKKPITKEFINIDTVIDNALNPFPTGINGYRDYSVAQKFEIPIMSKLDLELNGNYYHHNEYDFVPDNVYQNFEDYSYGGKLQYQISERYHLTASYHYDNYRKFDYYEKLDEKAMNYRNVFINPKLLGNFKAGKYQEFTGGVEYLSESLTTDKFSDDSLSEKKTATSVFFAQDDITLGNHWNFILGARFDNHSVFGLHFSPKLSGMYKLKHWTFRANYAKGFRSPNLKELYMDWPVAWFTIKGDENLKPETNNYFSGSVEIGNSFINASATGYYNKLKNKIDGEWQNGQTVYQYVNVSEAVLSGFEMMMQIYFLNHFMLSGAYNYLSDKRPQGELVSSASPHTGNIKLNYQLTKRKYKLNVNLNVNIIGAKNYQVSEPVDYRGEIVEGIYPVHFDAYAIWRLTVSQHFLNGINIIVGVDNLFDYRADVVSFNTSTSPGRKGFVSLNFNIEKFFNTKNH